MKFISEIKYKTSDKKGFWFIFNNSNMLYTQKKDNIIPELISPSDIDVATTTPLYFGTIDGVDCWTAEALDNNQTADCHKKSDFDFKNLRELYSLLGDDFFSLAGRALQLGRWYNSTKYCSSCSGELKDSETERAKICKSCSKIFYPVISPAIIVAVTKENKILLAHNNAYPDPNRYSIIAGFVEPGESLEQTVAREVEEEVSIKIKNIKYYGSQSWPFPHSLMLGFTAEYDSGEIKTDGVEIGAAGWFEVSNLPGIPPRSSISRTLIDNFIKNNS
ncbi:MAG: NAD(+) diphosphatase [Spirochaetaceae bacterium]|nr:NAD(+) diphosphatase [Spirochaetaceae bacterium]